MHVALNVHARTVVDPAVLVAVRHVADAVVRLKFVRVDHAFR